MHAALTCGADTPMNTMEAIEKKIELVEADIASVEKAIVEIEKKLTEEDLSLDDKKYYRRKEEQLRRDKEQLRRKEEQLREQLRRIEEQLLRKEEQQHEEKLILLRKEHLPPVPEGNPQNLPFDRQTLFEVVREAIADQDRATPRKSPASHGNDELARLKQRKKINHFESSRLEASILSEDEAKELLKQNTEHEIVAFLTPHFQEVFQQDETSTVVVNSEEYTWLQTSDDSKYNQKPDLFVCHKSMYKDRAPFNTKSDKLAGMRTPTNKFGILASWNLRRFIYVVCEAKRKIDSGAFGEIINYGAHICFKEDGPVTLPLLLFDTDECWLIECVRGTAASILKCKWTDPGSRYLLKDFAFRHPLVEILDESCEYFNLFVKPDSFLGEGAFGVVFRVFRKSDGKALALKIVTAEKDKIRDLEQQRQLTERAKSICPDLVVGIEKGGYKLFPARGAVLLQSEVGDPYKNLQPKQITDSLLELHSNNILHGDCRVENVVCVDREPRWIDFRETLFCTAEASQEFLSTQKAKEMASLRESIRRMFHP